MSTAYSSLCDRFKRMSQLQHALTFLSWDQMVMMPPAGVASRSAAMAELAGLAHQQLTAADMQSLLGEAHGEAIESGDAGIQASVREMSRQWEQAACLPDELVKARIVAGSRCEHAWREQRGASDWVGFLENFREVVRLSRDAARYRQATDPDRFATPYDALLDAHCAGDTSSMIDRVFDQLRDQLPDLLHRVLDRQSAADPVPEGPYPIADQKAVNEVLMKKLGFDFNAGRLDVSMHPFSTGVRDDLRITTRFDESEFVDALQGTAHETGHASYESGLPESLDGLPVGLARNMCIHESQSVLFERHLFASRPFLESFLPDLHAHLPAMKNMDAQSLWRRCIRVDRGYIRVEADEVTYPLHVMLRYDIERALINGDLEPDEIPTLWDEKMRAYLGLSTGNNHNIGCLQDIHWTDGAFGYFPSYAIGAVNAAQLMASIRSQHSDWQERLAAGDVAFIRSWLRSAIWEQGSLLESQELMASATGEASNAQYLLDHLEARYVNGAY